MASNPLSSPTNLQKAAQAWGADMPAWLRLLASACDATSQRVVGDRIGLHASYVSRIINRSYAASYDEAERMVRAAYGNEDVVCPLFGPIPLASCIRNRRRKGSPRNQMQHQFAATCPECPNNSDGGHL